MNISSFLDQLWIASEDFFISILVTLLMILSLFRPQRFLGEYLSQAEVKWVKTGVPRVKPLKRVKEIFPLRWGRGPFTKSHSAIYSCFILYVCTWKMEKGEFWGMCVPPRCPSCFKKVLYLWTVLVFTLYLFGIAPLVFVLGTVLASTLGPTRIVLCKNICVHVDWNIDHRRWSKKMSSLQVSLSFNPTSGRLKDNQS